MRLEVNAVIPCALASRSCWGAFSALTVFLDGSNAGRSDGLQRHASHAKRSFAPMLQGSLQHEDVGSSSQANYLLRNTAMDDSIGGS